MMIHEIDRDALGKEKDRIRTRSYSRSLCGPVIRVKPGDLLKIHLRNDIRRQEEDKAYDPAHPNAPHGFNVTNLHTHGLNVSPRGRSDNVFLEVGPEESIDLCFDIPKTHTAGTFWYHAHKHGSVAMQLAGGMAGVLIVDGGKGSLDEVPEIAAATAKEHERILVFQQIPYRNDPSGNVVDVKAEDVYALPKDKAKRIGNNTLISDTLINGELFPTITMRPGEVQRWRCVHAGLEMSLNLVLADEKLDGVDPKNRLCLHEIAVDGLPLGTLKKCTNILLHPGYRTDLLVEAPPVGRTYLLQAVACAGKQCITGIDRIHTRYLARVRVEGIPMKPKMKLPDPEKLRGYRLKSIEKIDCTREVVLVSDDENKPNPTRKFWINKQSFAKHDRPVFFPKLGSTEEWTLKANAGRHPFHIHVNPFEVIYKDNKGNVVERIWRDTFFVTDDDEEDTKIRLRFERFTGKTVMHCHNLRHEDQGMMAAIEIIPHKGRQPSDCPKLTAGFKTLPTEAPLWTMLDVEKTEHQSIDFKGKQLLLVFSRGAGCAHCRAQVQELRAKSKKLRDAGLRVVVVCLPVKKLPPKAGLPFLLLADNETLSAFKSYGCHDGRALHGTFLIDSKGTIRWQDVGDEPFMDVNTVLKKAKELK